MARPEQTTENRLTSERLYVFQDALETLYIKNNISGRLKFSGEWPDAGAYIFGPDLLHIDHVGSLDKEYRAALEDAAEGRRIELLETVMELENSSVKGGVLQMEYVQQTIMRYGRKVSLILYADKIVDRFIPAPAGEKETAPVQKQKVQEIPEDIPLMDIPQRPKIAEPEPVFEDEEEKKAPQRPEDNIQPISTDAPKPAAAPAPVAEERPIKEPPAPPPLVEDVSPGVPKKRGVLKIFGIKDSSQDS